MDIRLFLNFRIQLLLSLILLVVVVTGTTIYLTEATPKVVTRKLWTRNFRANAPL